MLSIFNILSLIFIYLFSDILVIFVQDLFECKFQYLDIGLDEWQCLSLMYLLVPFLILFRGNRDTTRSTFNNIFMTVLVMIIVSHIGVLLQQNVLVVGQVKFICCVLFFFINCLAFGAFYAVESKLILMKYIWFTMSSLLSIATIICIINFPVSVYRQVKYEESIIWKIKLRDEVHVDKGTCINDDFFNNDQLREKLGIWGCDVEWYRQLFKQNKLSLEMCQDCVRINFKLEDNIKKLKSSRPFKFNELSHRLIKVYDIDADSKTICKIFVGRK